MNIKKQVIENYKFLCPTSALKCADEEEIRYKIIRAVSIGKKTNGKHVGHYIIDYHNLRFFYHRRTNTIGGLNLLRGSYKNSAYHYVDERLKQQYDSIHRKISKVTLKEVKSINIVNVFKNKVNVYKGFLKLIFN